MKTHSSKDETLHFAMHNAQDCAKLFYRLASVARNPEMEKVFDDLARAELAHSDSLSRLYNEGKLPEEMFSGININGYLHGYHPEEDLKYINVLEVTMRKMRIGLNLYLEMASKSTDKEVRELFKSMAVKENAHKLLVEAEYNDSILL